MTIQKVFDAGLTHRWHTNPHLAGTVDRLDGHQARVARLALYLFDGDCTVAFITACLTHDDGESVTGDIPFPNEKTPAQVEAEESAWGDIWGTHSVGAWCRSLSDLETRRLKFCDRLDAYMWMRHHRPDLRDRSDWVKALTWLKKEAHLLGLVGLRPVL